MSGASTIRERLKNLTVGSWDPTTTPVVGFMTTTIDVKDKKDIIGFIYVSGEMFEYFVHNIPERDWEKTRAFTGLTGETYQAFIDRTEKDFLENLKRVLDGGICAAFCSPLTRKCLEVLGVPCYVIDIMRMNARATSMIDWDNMEECPEPEKLISWINKASVGRTSRKDAAQLIGVANSADTYGFAALGNVITDADMWNKILDRVV